MSRRGTSGGRQYPRAARLNKLFQEILAEELDRIDDDRLELLTVMDVEVDNELSRAVLFYMLHDEDQAAEAAAALADHRVRLQGALGSQARIRRVPELVFRPDEVTRSAARIEEILRTLPETRGDDGDGADDGGAGGDEAGDEG